MELVVTSGAIRCAKPPANQHPVFYRLDALPVAQPTVAKLCLFTFSIITASD